MLERRLHKTLVATGFAAAVGLTACGPSSAEGKPWNDQSQGTVIGPAYEAERCIGLPPLASAAKITNAPNVFMYQELYDCTGQQTNVYGLYDGDPQALYALSKGAVFVVECRQEQPDAFQITPYNTPDADSKRGFVALGYAALKQQEWVDFHIPACPLPAENE